MRWKWLRVLLQAAALLVLLFAGGVWLLLQSVDRGAVMARAVQEVKAATGRDFAIEGPVHLSLLPSLALVAEGVRLGNAPWGSRPDMARIEQLRFDIAIEPLLQRRVEIGRIEINGADLLLETDADGQGNWNFERATPADKEQAPPAEPAAGAIRVTLAQLGAKDARLSWRSGRSGHTEQLVVEALSLDRHPDPARSPNAWRVAADAIWRAQKIHAEGGVGLQRDEQTGARAIPLDLDLRMEGVSADIDGTVGLGRAAGQAQLKVQAEIEATRALAQMLRMKLPLPVPARLSGDLVWRAHQLQVDDFEIESQGQAVAGTIVWDRAATPPALVLDLHTDSLEMARLFPAQRAGPPAPDAQSSSGGGTGRVFSDTPFPSLSLPPLAIRADLRAERLVLPNGLELGAVQLRGSSSAERIDIAQLDFGLARGRFSLAGGWQQAAGNAAPRITAQARARGVAMDALLALTRRGAVLSGGRTELDARLSASGNSPRRLAASLDGELRLRMGEASSTTTRRGSGNNSSTTASVPGELVSALLHALTPLRRSDDSFKVLCAAARLPVKAGRIDIDRSIAIEGERVDVVMSGLIDLAAERVELGMRPTVKKGTGLDATAFAGVVKIAGPLAAPQVQVNLAGTAREAVTIGAAVATSGATILGERLLGRVNDAHPCDSAYSGSARTTAGSAARAGQAASQQKSGVLGGRLRGLFER